MSEASLAPPPGAGAATFLLTVRGKVKAATTQEARTVHNSTAGSPAGVEAARSLGDLSHQVFTGYGDGQAGEVLFIDFWNSLPGLGQFFSDPQVLAGADLLFSSRDAPVWSATSGFGDFHLTIPAGKAVTGVGLIRVKVSSLDKAADAFTAYTAATINASRRHGIVSHSVWSRVPNPGDQPDPEVIGVDLWMDTGKMTGYYDLGLGFDALGPVFAGTPDTSVWQSAPGDWTEW
jgi:hypothetical protein